MRALQLIGLSKMFGNVVAVDRLNLEVQAGQFVSLLGPSGCGKTTTLRMIAGLEIPDAGDVLLGDENITHLPPDKRKLGMVFQDYALFPHMTVEANVAFGLEMQKVPKDKTQTRVGKALDLVRLAGLQMRYPNQLSGGQQQRVALARALVVEPQLLLLDEPLSNLDAKLRQQMRVELKQIQGEVGITTIFVTHDQEEALTLSDSIVLLSEGKLVQVGTPVEIYEHPRDSFVASFLGQENIFKGRVTDINQRDAQVLTEHGLTITTPTQPDWKSGQDALLVVRKERIRIKSGDAEFNSQVTEMNNFAAAVDFVTYLGTTIQYLCSIGGQQIMISVQNEAGLPRFQQGDQVQLMWETSSCTSIAIS